MKIIVAGNNRLNEKTINSDINVVTFDYNDIFDYFKITYLEENKVKIEENKNYYDLSNNILELNSKVTVNSKDDKVYEIYLLNDISDNYYRLYLNTNEVIIGSTNLSLCNLNIKQFELNLEKITFNIIDNNINLINDSNKIIYVNNYIYNNTINYGDLIFIDGVFIVFVGSYIYLFNVDDFSFDKDLYKEEYLDDFDINKYKDIVICEYIDDNSFSNRALIKKDIIEQTFNIDPPSSVELKENNPLFLTMMPMLLMSSTSIIMSINIINNIRDGKSTWKDNKMSLIFSAVMIFTMILYPIIQNAYRKRKQSKREIKRIEEYKDYIYENKIKILKVIDEQKNILLSNFKDTETCINIFNKNLEEIWDKKSGDSDFLTVSLGSGRIVPKIRVNYPEEHFTIDRDKLRIQIEKLKESVSYIDDCPITINLFKNNNLSFIGQEEFIYKYLESFIFRILFSHSYNDIRFCVFSDENKKYFWEKYSSLSYFWNDDKSLRFYAYNESSMSNIVNYLNTIYKERLDNEKKVDKFINYIIFIDNLKIIQDVVFLKELLNNDNNLGFTVIFLSESMKILPSYCKDFIELNRNESKLIIKENNYKEVKFIPDLYDIDYSRIYQKLSSLYNSDNISKIPDNIPFLDLYKVDGVDKLNIVENWKNNTTLENMSVPIGINDHGEIVNIDLHENAHGPHGLIAGMTGSGKSEFIISLILSLSVNYSPLDVQFVLIDYKGGGLSNTFYSSKFQKKLPHIVGVITNISESEINRCLISLESEMKRRQVLFSDVSIRFNEGNMDIYKYQQIAKNNKDIEYLSHLIIISDEFAELKTQNPEFIEKLVSLARIGRSLGIHLILSTQKPSGVVDSQIWSNSKFKICLKVQDKSDSKEVIGVDDAVYLNNPGRFFMQIGYNELFIKGQSAYASAPYYLIESNSKMNNYKLDFINEYGKVYHTYNSFIPDELSIDGTHVSNVVNLLIDKSNELNYNVKTLWKDSLEEKIYLDKLLMKYSYTKSNDLEIIFGEYDEVDKQRKGLASYNLVNKGNIIIYGIGGSGKSETIQSTLYFLTKTYTPTDINIYVMDFALENSKVFMNYPQVGDVMYLYEKEKIINTFKYLNSVLNNRKNLLVNYGGNLLKYNKENDNKLPVILLVISNLERFFENYNELENIFMDFTRDCNKFGITLMVTLNGVNSVRNKLISNFQQVITLELKDKYDYDSLFGSKVKYKLPHILGRGFIKKDNVYEMQVAFITDEEDVFDFIESDSFEVSNKYDIKALPIPILPEVVSFDIMKEYLVDNNRTPIGIDVDTLEVVNYEFYSKEGLIISGNDIDLLDKYIRSFSMNLLHFSNNRVFVFSDGEDVNINNVVLIKDDYQKYFEQLLDYIDKSDSNTSYFIIFKSLVNILDNLEIKVKQILYTLLDKIRLSSNFKLILVDTISSIKKIEYNEFYTNNFNNNKGIFIGEGVGEQYVIKINRIPRKYRELQDERFGYYIENNKIKCIKLLEYIDYE